MNQVRGLLMIVAATVAVWKGWKIHAGSHAWLAYGLAGLALGMAAWHFTRPADMPRGGAIHGGGAGGEGETDA